MSSWAKFLRPASVLVLIFACTVAIPTIANAQAAHRRLDKTLNARARAGIGESRVIVKFKPGTDASAQARQLGARLGRRLRANRRVMFVSNLELKRLAALPAVESVRWDRPVSGLPKTHAKGDGVGSGLVGNLAYTGAGVGVAIIDSGIAPWHDDLTYAGASSKVKTRGGQRVAAFVDYTQGTQVLEDVPAYDDYGHGTHVAGIIAGNGFGAKGVTNGLAPEAHLVVLKVLDATGRGFISDVIDALGYAVANKDRLNIRVVNLSIAAAVLQSIDEDPLAQATKEATDHGIVVVAAAGNLGRGPLGLPQYGGITAPGNAPWVLTVGAYDQQDTANPTDDVVAAFSSRGPTAIDFRAKPDVLAPGKSIISLSDPSSTLYATRTAPNPSGSATYLTLSGTSVAAPAVAGTVALMAQAYPPLTPNLAKAVVQYTARFDPDYDRLTQGAGYLNPAGAVKLVRYFKVAREGQRYPLDNTWGRKIIWGNYLLGGGVLWPNASAWAEGVVWGAMPGEDGDNIVWGTLCEPEDCDNIVWGTFEDGDNIVWGTDEDGDNIVWGTRCDTEDCDNIVWGTLTEDGDNIVWGTGCAPGGEDCDNIVWGTAEDIDNIVWGTDCRGEDCDNIVWGTLGPNEDGDNIVWGTAEDVDNIVWGTVCTGEDCDNIVWGTDCRAEDCDNIVWGTAVVTAPAQSRKTKVK